MTLTITCYTDPDGLWGNAPTDDYDIDASVSAYEKALTKAIKFEYPDAVVYHEYGQTMRTFEIENDVDVDTEIIERCLEECVNDVYADYNWLVPA